MTSAQLPADFKGMKNTKWEPVDQALPILN